MLSERCFHRESMIGAQFLAVIAAHRITPPLPSATSKPSTERMTTRILPQG
jgi:hypothetical protein